MEQTTTSNAVTAADGRAKYDEACKRVLSEKVILARIMKACMEEYKDCDVNDIIRYIEGDPQVSRIPVDQNVAPVITGIDTEDKTITEGTKLYDIRFKAFAPTTGDPIQLIINVEAQNDFNPGYPLLKRGIYYCSRMISSQYGREFTGKHYEKIKKVYSIWICLDPDAGRENTITRYRMIEECLEGAGRDHPQNYDLITMVMVCLSGKQDASSHGILRLLDVLLSNKFELAAKKTILTEDYSIPMTEAMDKEVNEMCNLSQGIWNKGIDQGRTEGRAEERVSLIKQLLKTMSPEAVASALAIPLREVLQMQKA